MFFLSGLRVLCINPASWIRHDGTGAERLPRMRRLRYELEPQPAFLDHVFQSNLPIHLALFI